MFSSIRTKLIASYLILIVAVMLAASFFLLTMLRNYYHEYHADTMVGAASLVRDLVVSKLRETPDVVDISNQAEFVAKRHNVRILVTDDRQRVVGDSVRVDGLVGVTLNRREISDILSGNEIKSRSIQYSETSKQWVMQVTVPVVDQGKIIGTVFVSSSLSEIYNLQNNIKNYLIILTLLSIALAGLLGRYLAQRITDPIQLLTQAAEKMARGDLSQRVAVRTSDEIGRLTKQFNEMAKKLAESTRQLKDFVANASHEMRTPLTSLNILVKSLREYPLEAEEREEFLADIDKELERLIRLVENLLDLTRLDRLAKEDTMSVVDIVPTVANTLSMLQRRAEEKSITLEIRLPERASPVFAALHQIKQVVFNLVDNALKYTPAHGRVEVVLSEEGDCLKLSVSDNGVGIPEEHREKIFERFYRVDKARSRELGGTGLGLAIVAEIVKRHGGTIAVEDGPGGIGTTFIVTIPRYKLPPE